MPDLRHPAVPIAALYGGPFDGEIVPIRTGYFPDTIFRNEVQYVATNWQKVDPMSQKMAVVYILRSLIERSGLKPPANWIPRPA